MVAAFLPEKKSKWKIYVILTLVLVILSAFFLFFALNAILARFNQDGPGNLAPISVSHWSGYMITLNLENRSDGVSSISASWIVPSVNYSQQDTYSSVWIGVGGYGEQTLIQAGTEQQCVNGEFEYFGWYELLPDHSIKTQSLNVQPGDQVSVTIRLLNQDQNTWQIIINDETNGSHFEKSDIVYKSSQKSAEWILERPTVNDKVSTLSDFGNVTMTNCSTNINDVTGSIKDFTYQPIIMVDSVGYKLTATSSLSSDGSSFSVAYINQFVNETTNPSST
jgi:hypothetical protein